MQQVANKKEEMTTREAKEFVGLKDRSDQTFRRYVRECGITGHQKRGRGHMVFYWKDDVEKLKAYIDSPRP